MDTEILKILSPTIFFILLVANIRKFPSYRNLPIFIFTFSIVSFSQNFTLMYREAHQAIQILLSVAFFVNLIIDYKLPRVSIFPICFLLFIATSFFRSPIDTDAKIQCLNFLVCTIVALFTFKNLKNLTDTLPILNFISQLSIASALLGIIEFALTLTPRIEGTFSNPNYLALFLGIGWCCTWFRLKGPLKWTSLILILLAIILTGSRSGLVFPIFYLAWIVFRQKNKVHLIIYGTSAIFLVLAVFVSGVTRFSNSKEVSASDSERILFAKIAVNMANSHALTGVGWGRFISEFENFNKTVEKIEVGDAYIDVSNQERRVTHNDFLRILAELGYPAFVSSVLFILWAGYIIYKEKSFGIDPIFPIWLGIIFFSASHNNLNTAFTWIFILLPVHLKYFNSSNYVK